MAFYDRLTLRAYALLSAVTIGLSALILRLMGRNWICTNGTVKLWIGDINSNELSQHLTDWYTFTHVLHGLLYCLGIWIVDRTHKWPRGLQVLITVVGASAWEILENTNWIIEHYRTRTASAGYFGDSIINAVTDILAAVLGLYIATRIKWQYSLLIYIAVEAFLLFAIRDSLTLNILMLIWPIEALKKWQLSP